ncbi:hypothetical protein EB796_004125 [Bugula neritina]|uniref:Uncharacterized protein n=1 Tax=Bugula neritina TaxID=10212 RepID=A0A7J7KH22_BUGNE|nr:hypothetical protein EB796_004125 [Bugula neritina]
MEGEKDFQIDSMYEMDAPMFREFNETDYSVNESIFEKKTVGEKQNFEDSTLFRSPGGVFRDISNTTSTMSNNSRISLKSNLAYMTPPQKSPALAKRRITRSVTKALQTAKDHDNTLIEEGCSEEHMENLTPSKSTSESGKKKLIDQVDSITSTTSAITSTDSVAAVAELPIEEPPVKLHNSTSRSSLSKNSTEINLSSSKKSTPAVKLGRVSAIREHHSRARSPH